ncbi:MAG: VRR-NUC domain-containing protein [Selenomonadaceae bacterium]|nr:VRR-NUC domain-containing protein [Selenomonadaceae bacterium]
MFQDEKRIERHLVEGVRREGGLCFKFVSPGTAGVPDRLIILPDGRVVFAELKTETGRLSKIQEYTINELKKRNADVRVLYGLQDVKAFLSEVVSNEI